MKYNYSEPHSQNRYFVAFLLLMWLLRHIKLLICLNASIRRTQFFMALNSYKISPPAPRSPSVISHPPYPNSE